MLKKSPHIDARVPSVLSWDVCSTPLPYPGALAAMESHVNAMISGQASEKIWLLEHPPVYTAGTSARVEDLRDPRFPVYQTGRGGQYTYHGPLQRVVYPMLDLGKRQATLDVRAYVWCLEEWIIRSLSLFGITGARRAGRVGIWIGTQAGDSKIGALGIRIRRKVAFHGFSVNVDPDLSHFSGIVPCGLSGYGVTSIAAILGKKIPLSAYDEALQETWPDISNRLA